MKTTSLKVYTLFTVIGLVLASCGGLGKMEKHIEELNAKAEPEPLIVRGDSVEVTITGKFPEKYFHKKVAVEATPVLTYEGGESAFDMKGYQGEDAAANFEVIPYETGKSFSYTDKVAYDPAMENAATLELRLSGTKGSQSASFDPLPVGTGVITTPYLMMSDDKPIMATDNFQRILSFTQDAIVNYNYNSSNVASAELRDQDIKDARALIALADTFQGGF